MVLLFKILEEALAIEDKILVFRYVQTGKKSEKIIIFFLIISPVNPLSGPMELLWIYLKDPNPVFIQVRSTF